MIPVITQQWDTGWLIGLSVAAFFAAAGLAAFLIGAARYLTARNPEDGISGPVSLTGAAVFVVAGIAVIALAWPFSGQYHRYQPLGGTVTAVNSRLIASNTQGGGSTQKFVLTFKDGLALGCNDTRCSQVAVGDTVILPCERTWQWNASQGWDCNWGHDEKPDGTVVP